MVSIHVRPTAIEKHKAAPLCAERERFLVHRRAQGMCRKNVRGLASTLLHVVRLLNLVVPRQVTLAEIERAGDSWAADTEHLSYRQSRKYSKKSFVTGARIFLRFHGLLDLQVPPQPFGGELEQYLQVLRDQRGLASSTLENHRAHVGNFLKWIAGHNLLLSEITAADVASYIRFKRETCSVLTVSTAAQPLRSFFTYGESQHWCVPNLRDVLTFPNRRRYDPDTVIPTWEDVRRVLDEAIGNKPADLRNRAMLLLCSIYGLRSSEVARVRLGDIDWKEETLSITRSKNGRTQQFPLQYEIGEAILKYLIHGRPQCSCRNVFVSLNCPYRPITPTTLNLVTATRMALLQIKSTKMGPHALRHACATQLLRSGTSLRQIADFLGHRDLSTVSVYARLDTEALREVAGFSLKAILCN